MAIQPDSGGIFDFETGLNFHAQQNILRYLQQAHDKPIRNILKSHHPVSFFDGIMEYILDQFHVFYIYRDPRDVMVSFWKLIRGFEWDEGPRTETVGDFIRSEPRAALLRYQKNQEPNMLHRWAHHVNGWVSLAEKVSRNHPMLVRYEDLNIKFENTLLEISDYLGKSLTAPEKPALDVNVIGSGKGKINTYKEYLTKADEIFVTDQIGDTMERLGYS